MNDQCVYTHVHPENKTVFYVGMSIIKRAYNFNHVEYGSITCLQCELRRLFGLDQAALRRVVIGQQKQHKGWAVVK